MEIQLVNYVLLREGERHRISKHGAFNGFHPAQGFHLSFALTAGRMKQEKRCGLWWIRTEWTREDECRKFNYWNIGKKNNMISMYFSKLDILLQSCLNKYIYIYHWNFSFDQHIKYFTNGGLLTLAHMFN